ncbi:hypothetical protein [Streptomyces litchfieldiae]|uniref:Uncharacterized protein n=1 Tax=Streptomyces litchfieldiae TaxID=3075543 RepID=A0ABU2N138_9ACTN|nr:hypothetical protein [Streptomyces sp. DSM 44938]MDT0347615.1 hypothetical protein [Streptomyces sp. DSM 44938]
MSQTRGLDGPDRGVSHRSRAWVRRRLRSLAALELLNIALQAAIWFGGIGGIGFGLPMTAANAVGFGLFSLLLVQGAVYWLAKLRLIAAPGGRLPGATAFVAARVLNVPLLAVGVLITAWAVAERPGRESWPGLGFALFAVVEQVNYFHWQLMYDTRRDLRHLRMHGLRRAHLARDLSPDRGVRPRDRP